MGRTVRIWRYLAATNRWEYKPSHGSSSYLNASEVDISRVQVVGGAAGIVDRSWLFEEKLSEAVPPALTANLVRAVVQDSLVPDNATVWCCSKTAGSDTEGKFSRIYRRRNATANVREAPGHVNALFADCADGDVVLDMGEDTDPVHVHFTGGRTEFEEVQLDRAGGSFEDLVDLGTMSGPELYILVVRMLAEPGPAIATAIMRSVRAIRSNSEEEFMAACGKLLELFTGAAPAPTQGTNFALQLTTAIDDSSKVLNAIQLEIDSKGRISGFDMQGSGSDSGALGSAGGTVGTVDMTWQAAASVISLAIDVLKVGKMCSEWSRDSMSSDKRIDFEKLLRGRGLTLGSNLMKSYSTVTSSVGMISGAVSSASILSAGVATSVPIVGSVTGLATMVRSSWQAEKSRKRARNLARLRKIMQEDRGDLENETQQLLSFAMGKAMRRHKFKAAEATVAAGSTGAGVCLAIGAAAAGANFWNPIGWGIGAVVVVAGTGLLSYKVYRRVRSSHRAKKRGFKSSEFSRKLVYAYQDAFDQHKRLDTIILGGILESYGIEPAWLQIGSAADGERAIFLVDDAVYRIDRHFS